MGEKSAVMGEKSAVMEEKGAVTEEKSAGTEQESAILVRGASSWAGKAPYLYQGRRHRQKRFWSGKRTPSRTRRASFFVGRTPKRTKRALLWKERVRCHWLKGAISAQRGAISICSKECSHSQVKKK